MAVELKVDFAIVGGGPAGLAAASKLVAQAYTVLLYDEAGYRAESQMTSMFSAYPFNAMNPIDYRRRAHRILAEQFNIQLRSGRVTSVHRIDNEADSHFILTVEERNGEDTKNAEHQAKKVILALGSREEAPNIEGYSLLRHSIIHEDVFSFGIQYWTNRQNFQSLPGGILALGPLAEDPNLLLRTAAEAQQVSRKFGSMKRYENPDERTDDPNKVVIFTNGMVESSEIAPYAEKYGLEMDTRSIVKFSRHEDGVEIMFQGGERRLVRFLVHKPQMTVDPRVQTNPSLELLAGNIKAEAPNYQTSVQGIFAAGDCISNDKFIPHAIGTGHAAAAAAAAQFQADKLGLPQPFE